MDAGERKEMMERLRQENAEAREREFEAQVQREMARANTPDDPPAVDDAKPSGVDLAWWRKYRQRQEAERKAARAKEQSVNATRDATPFTELQMAVIADALSEIRFQLREEIKALASELAALRERSGNVTVFEPKQRKSPGDAA
jgi:hypothetical protein